MSENARTRRATGRRRDWLSGQRNALESALNGEPLEQSLGVLVQTAIDTLGPGARAAFYLSNRQNGTLRHVVGMPAEYADAVAAVEIGPESLACGLATRDGEAMPTGETSEPVLVRDVNDDERWKPWRWLAQRFDYRACWSFPIRTSGGRLVGVFAVYSREPREATTRDLELAAYLIHTAAMIISRHKEWIARSEAEATLRESEERLRLAAEATGFGTYDFDVARSESIWSPQLRAILQHPGDGPVPPDEVLSTIHPDDRGVHVELMRGMLDPAGPALHRAEFRIVRKDGEIRWVRDTGRVYYDGEGRSREPVRVVGTLQDVTEQKSAELALRDADRMKDEFLAVLGHELRNPLAPLRSGLDLLEQARERPEIIDSIAPIMDRQLSHLTRLVDDLLDVSRISRGRIALRWTALDVNHSILAAVEQTQGDIDERGHALSVELCESPVTVSGDFERLTQVVANLLSNAAKYTEPGGRIVVQSAVEDDEVIVRVRDNGFGIPPEWLGHLFALFSQVPAHRELTGSGGLGIGLALSEQLIAMHGGSIGASSDGPGKGSEFVVRLPRSPEPAPRGAGDAKTRETRSQRVVVVDDNADAAALLARLLELQGHRVRAAHSAHEALRLVEAERPDVVLLDLGLPVIDGIEVARRIRSMPGGGEIRIIAVTGWGQDSDRARTREAGFDDHLTKPVDSARLESALAASEVD